MFNIGISAGKAVSDALFLSLALSTLLFAQRIGDHRMPGVDGRRSGHQCEAVGLSPPFDRVQSLALSGASADWRTLLAFQGGILVGGNAAEEVSSAGPSQIFRFIPTAGFPTEAWRVRLGGAVEGEFRPRAAFSDSIVLFSDAATTFTAVGANDGTLLWKATGMGRLGDRLPILDHERAFLHGSEAVAALDARDGRQIWRTELPSAPAPLTRLGGRLFLVGSEGRIHGLNGADGVARFLSAFSQARCPCRIMASDGRLFLADVPDADRPGVGRITAIDAVGGDTLWQREAPRYTAAAWTVLALGQVIAAGGVDRGIEVVAFDAETGEELWRRFDRELSAPPFGSTRSAPLVAGRVFYYHSASNGGRTRMRDISDGSFLGAFAGRNDDMVATRGQLLILGENRVRFFEPIERVFLVHFADGEGQTTRISIFNPGLAAVEAKVTFRSSVGFGVEVELEHGLEEDSKFNVLVPPLGYATLRTAGRGLSKSGWVEVASAQPLRATAAFQARGGDGALLGEANVDQSLPRGEALIPVEAGLGVNTALAVVNPNTSDMFLALKLTLEDGEIIHKALLLRAGHHRARFVDEFFDLEIPGGNRREGILHVAGKDTFLITAIRTRSGIQTSSLPAAHQ